MDYNDEDSPTEERSFKLNGDEESFSDDAEELNPEEINDFGSDEGDTDTSY